MTGASTGSPKQMTGCGPVPDEAMLISPRSREDRAPPHRHRVRNAQDGGK